ncbi:MAG: hypothetical protein M3Y09_02640 [Actinomycetota bacterium]|nr:hypothetical protein [Actinomycetota bacterium]
MDEVGHRIVTRDPAHRLSVLAVLHREMVFLENRSRRVAGGEDRGATDP